MPLVDKKDQAERWGPDKNKSLILYATSKEKKEANPKLPDFQGYVADSSGNIYRAVGWRKKSQNGTVMLSGLLEETDGAKTEESKENTKPADSNEEDIPF